MAIWKSRMSVEQINEMIENTMDPWVGIAYTEVGDDFVKASMTVDHRTLQPFGILHGGASCVLAESVGSIAGNMCVEQTVNYCAGQSIHTNHVRKAVGGEHLVGTARPVHLGKTSQLWEIRIENEAGDLISVTRLQLAVLSKKWI